MKEQTRSELKRLPYTIGKVIGGLLAVIGFGAAVYVYTHRAASSFNDVSPFLAAGIAGLIIFLVCSWSLSKKARDNEGSEPAGKEKKRANALSWTILLILTAAFIAFVFIKAG